MISTDQLVGCVSIGLGAFFLSAAIFNWEWYYQIRKVHWVESRWGRNRARTVNVVLGFLLIGLGCAIAMGFGPNRSSSRIFLFEPPNTDTALHGPSR